MTQFERSALMEKFRAMAARGEPIVGGGAGTGLSAKCEEAGGVDLIVIYNSGRYRMAGRGSLAGLLAYGDANAIVVDMARGGAAGRQAHARARRRQRHRSVPPDGRLPRSRSRRSASPACRTSRPSASSTATFRANLEETGMSYGLEVDMIAKARAKDLLTTPYVFNEDEAEAMARAGADIIVCHMGLTTGGAIGAETALKLDDCPALIDAWAGAALQGAARHPGARARRPDRGAGRRGLHHEGRPRPATASMALPRWSGCRSKRALTEQVRRFKAIGRKR